MPPTDTSSDIYVTFNRQNMSTTDPLETRIRACFHKFSGKNSDRATFYEKFTIIAELQGLNILLCENPNCNSQMMLDALHISKSY